MKHFYVVYNYTASNGSHGIGSMAISTKKVIFRLSEVSKIVTSFNKDFKTQDIVVTDWKEITKEEHDVLYSV